MMAVPPVGPGIFRPVEVADELVFARLRELVLGEAQDEFRPTGDTVRRRPAPRGQQVVEALFELCIEEEEPAHVVILEVPAVDVTVEPTGLRHTGLALLQGGADLIDLMEPVIPTGRGGIDLKAA